MRWEEMVLDAAKRSANNETTLPSWIVSLEERVDKPYDFLSSPSPFEAILAHKIKSTDQIVDCTDLFEAMLWAEGVIITTQKRLNKLPDTNTEFYFQRRLRSLRDLFYPSLKYSIPKYAKPQQVFDTELRMQMDALLSLSKSETTCIPENIHTLVLSLEQTLGIAPDSMSTLHLSASTNIRNLFDVGDNSVGQNGVWLAAHERRPDMSIDNVFMWRNDLTLPVNFVAEATISANNLNEQQFRADPDMSLHGFPVVGFGLDGDLCIGAETIKKAEVMHLKRRKSICSSEVKPMCIAIKIYT